MIKNKKSKNLILITAEIFYQISKMEDNLIVKIVNPYSICCALEILNLNIPSASENILFAISNFVIIERVSIFLIEDKFFQSILPFLTYFE